jgi:uncharacterized membrane protein
MVNQEVSVEKLKQRFWEIDFLRGIAIVMMIFFHLLYDLNYFGVYSIAVSSGFWRYFARATASIFILLVGVSLTLSFSKAGLKREKLKETYMRYVKRGLKVFSWGLLITIVTWIFIPEDFIIFGILHFIGVSIILGCLFLKFYRVNLFAGIVFVVLGFYLENFEFSFPWLFWLGFMPKGDFFVDYFPLLPWFGLILIGMFIGKTLYRNYSRQFSIPDLGRVSFVRLFCFLGRKSLLIYLFHQPVLIGVLYLLGIIQI